MAFKARVIESFDNLQSKKSVARNYRIDKKCITRWLAQRERIASAIAAGRHNLMKLRPQNGGRFPNSEARLHDWFLGERIAGRAVSNLSLANRMRRFVGTRFRASSRWLQGMEKKIEYRMEKKILSIYANGNK